MQKSDQSLPASFNIWHDDHIPVEILGCSGGSERMNEWQNLQTKEWTYELTNELGKVPSLPKKWTILP